ncbi:MAG: 4Fe-4S binding protein [Thermosphaera aggregans]|jgi:Pyruvate:ferredoxin oxidoreductase and related 2-oxoacid:ferredoxin oxidoreductases, delta subunit|uniref:4Fe-4S binding protein n=1 Tax=Thermosphaera aggregans TaxID=54254 RepID=UPI003C0AA2AD
MSSQRGWKELPLGGIAYRLSTDVKTGDWRALKPVVDHNKCTKCMLCWLFCPEMAIVWDGEKIQVNYDYCKGCGICAHECPVKAISMIPEFEEV